MSPCLKKGFPGGASGKEPTCQCRRWKKSGLIAGSERSPGGGHGNPLSGNPMDRGAWWVTVHNVSQSWTQLSKLARMHANTIRNLPVRAVEEDCLPRLPAKIE